MVVGKNQHKAVLMPSSREIHPFVNFRGIEKYAAVDTVLILIEKGEGYRGMPYLCGFNQREDQEVGLRVLSPHVPGQNAWRAVDRRVIEKNSSSPGGSNSR